MNKGKLFVISAPSGAGKTTILGRVMANVGRLNFSISHTTRTARPGEQDGVDYHFVEQEDFIEMQEKGIFLESAYVHKNYYGTSREAVMAQLSEGVDVVLDIDVQGATILMESASLPATYIFIAPPDLSVLEERLRKRGSDSEETIKLRMGNAAGEMLSSRKYDYLIVNDDLAQASTLLKSIIWAERAKSRRTPAGLPIKLVVE
ncbi:guanylate kinase [Desulfotalea psychrophila]|uniref:Guanylate kinase n=1 Tax=Desulfotalea psychrophila (strain LSv54 / DSM 12343) TaxID=177439 RepID=KGUA_DESPS|nr:RecName: Full=Guanylate kinase; AltName: Full=GMP kinase [Desulfotalea psychrophila LSv54]CAG37589.1 probable guanylate kinase [Desulfotalea psychrophila LSv54]